MFLQELEGEDHFRQAEHHYVEGGDWKGAITMYRAKSLWDDAYRVSQSLLLYTYCQCVCTLVHYTPTVCVHLYTIHLLCVYTIHLRCAYTCTLYIYCVCTLVHYTSTVCVHLYTIHLLCVYTCSLYIYCVCTLVHYTSTVCVHLYTIHLLCVYTCTLYTYCVCTLVHYTSTVCVHYGYCGACVFLCVCNRCNALNYVCTCI